MAAAVDVVGRAGLKLEAALERFALDAEVRGARAVDVGASTGGFTEALLRHGAAHVVAVDAGHGQLAARLRGDARVESLEGADWKTLALGVAPGPFDFFTVDVSFVAARSMLRGLAFRLRDGAHGVVLVKPQFELPERLLRAQKEKDSQKESEKDGGKDGAKNGEKKSGKVDDPGLRRTALGRLTEKAERLGFTVLEHADSPVAGGSGTVELLAHLRFDGRPSSMPKLGERRPPPAKPRGPSARAAAPTAADVQRWFAVAAPGLEAVTAREVAALPGAREVRAVDGGVDFAGTAEVGYRANLWLRIATRVVVRLGEVTTREFGKLRHGVAALPWESFVGAGAKVTISASASRSRLYHTGAIAESVELGIADRLKRHGGAGGAPGEAPSVLVRGVDDRFMLSVDSSGELLHRRGWRQENAAAPMRETLAAGLLALCDFDPATALYDPMCGAGTIPIEACAQALGIAPGIGRRFAFEDWPLATTGDGRATWERLRDEARAAPTARAASTAQAASTMIGAARAVPPPIIVGADRSAPGIEAARRNAERAGLADAIQLHRQELADARPPPGAAPGLVLVNPPYGRRLGNPRTLSLLYREIGFVLRSHFRGWRAGVLVADRKLGDAIRLPVAASFPLSNGGLRVTLLRFEIA